MPAFSATSKQRLSTCHPHLVKLFETVIKYYDCTIIEGHRNEETQNRYFELGKSKLRYPEGKHNSIPSCAVDVAPYPIDWDDTNRFYHFAGYVRGVADALGIDIRWGGAWSGELNGANGFNDLVHFELILEDK